MKYADIDHTYLAKAVERIVEALKLVTKLPVYTEPMPDALAKATETQWIVYVLNPTIVDASSDSVTETWVVQSQLIWKPQQQQPDATLYRSMHVLAPQVRNYFQGHKHLKNTADQTPVPYLKAGQVTVTIERFNEGGQAGFVIVHRLPFGLAIDQEN